MGGDVINMGRIGGSAREALLVAVSVRSADWFEHCECADRGSSCNTRPPRSERMPNLRRPRGWRLRACRRDGSNWASADQASDPITPSGTSVPRASPTPPPTQREVARVCEVARFDASCYSAPTLFRRDALGGGSPATVFGRVCHAEASRCRPCARWCGLLLQ